MTELRRDTGLMRRGRGRLRGHQAELREESGHRDKTEGERWREEKEKDSESDGQGEWETKRSTILYKKLSFTVPAARNKSEVYVKSNKWLVTCLQRSPNC